jgi:hypothetical protein
MSFQGRYAVDYWRGYTGRVIAKVTPPDGAYPFVLARDTPENARLAAQDLICDIEAGRVETHPRDPSASVSIALAEAWS